MSQPAAPPWADTITLMRARGRRLAKMVHADGKISDYDKSFIYDAKEVPVAGHLALHDLLVSVLQRPDIAVVRGALVGGPSAQRIRRLVRPDQETGDQPTLRDVPRRWLAIDCDDVARPDDIPAGDLGACAELAIDRLPNVLHRAACIAQASGGHGIKPGIRLRLWYWLDRPMATLELKRWLKGCCDPSVFNAAQPIYTAAPVFEPPRTDHLPQRLFEYPGEDWVRCPTPEELEPPPRPIPETVHPVAVAGSARAALYVQSALDSARERIRNAGLRHPTILQESCGLARFVHAGLLSRSELQRALWSAASDAGKDDESEIERMIAFGLQHPSTNPIPVDLRNG
jgi:hypothetical protein